ncbi:MAG: type II toxin-antitoxin system ParD family antitoxin [Phycisphaerales bacterium]|nr:type II toxin-antitoxin system ParD family antitoxin [Phycisphaerales bacterium]MCB9857668.1 type II toxin-antitoxin system ParD family antitoxin [Phycisphaerales bacterium]
MNVSLTPKLEALVQAKLDTGLYNSASEVIRDALRLLEERDQLQKARLDNLRSELSKGLDELDAGHASDFDHSSLKILAKNIKSDGRKRLAANKKSRK